MVSQNTYRIGPDMPLTHWMLHCKPLMRLLCEWKFWKFGEGSEFRPGAYAVSCEFIKIGKGVVIRPGTMLFAETGVITIEDYVLMGPCVHIYVNRHTFSDLIKPIGEQGYDKIANVSLRKGCWIGANVTILPGVEVGRNAVVGAGSVVTKDVLPGTVVAGNPAKEISHA